MTASDINELFRKVGRTLGSVESFTGGLFADEITSTSGASHFYKGTLVTYATEEKNRLLGISYTEIDKYGVVSKEIAIEMARIGRKMLNVDYCVSFTGNAGPTAMENKPVGEIYIAIASKEEVQVVGLNIKGTRIGIRKYAVHRSYELLKNIIDKKFFEKK